MSAGELPDILSALTTIEADISGIRRVYDEPPETVAPADLPAVVHEFAKGSMERISAGRSRYQVTHRFPVTILVAPVAKGGLERAATAAYALLDDYLDALIDHDSLSNAVLSIEATEWEINAVEYAGVTYTAIQATVVATLVKAASA